MKRFLFCPCSFALLLSPTLSLRSGSQHHPPANISSDPWAEACRVDTKAVCASDRHSSRSFGGQGPHIPSLVYIYSIGGEVRGQSGRATRVQSWRSPISTRHSPSPPVQPTLSGLLRMLPRTSSLSCQTGPLSTSTSKYETRVDYAAVTSSRSQSGSITISSSMAKATDQGVSMQRQRE